MLSLKIIDLYGNYRTFEDEEIETMVDMKDEATIGYFKSYLLRITENQPFYLMHHMSNDDTVADLKKRT